MEQVIRSGFQDIKICLSFYTLRGHEWHFLIETMPEASGASSRWLRSVSDDTTGRRRDIRSSTPAGVPAAFFLDLMTGGVASLNHRLLALMPPASF